MFVPMKFMIFSVDFDSGATLLCPLWCSTTILRNQTTDVTNSTTFRDDTRLRQHAACKFQPNSFPPGQSPQHFLQLRGRISFFVTILHDHRRVERESPLAALFGLDCP